MGTTSLGDQAVELLARLVRLGCVNDLTADSGEEERAVEVLEDFFDGVPVSMERVSPHPGRTTLIVTVGADATAADGDGAGPLTLLGHTDVVPVDESKWTRDPFGAAVEDGVMWGRGTVDMLHLTASMAVVTREVARRAQRGDAPAHPLVFVAAADEEARGGLGVPWIGENMAQLVPWDAALSEMGGAHIYGRKGADSVVVVVGEKGAAQRRLHIRGDAGHGSVPLGRVGAVQMLARVSAALSAARWPAATDEVWAGFVRAFECDEATESALIEGTYEGDYSEFGDLAAYAHAISHVTVAQRAARCGGPINVLPSHATSTSTFARCPESTMTVWTAHWSTRSATSPTTCASNVCCANPPPPRRPTPTCTGRSRPPSSSATRECASCPSCSPAAPICVSPAASVGSVTASEQPTAGRAWERSIPSFMRMTNAFPSPTFARA